jgi:Domain of unknown function (DUF4288)
MHNGLGRSSPSLDGLDMAQRYYSARLLHAALVGGKPRRSKVLCDETVVLFKAADHLAAFKKAVKLGVSAEHEYRNQYRQIVRWAFVEVVAIKELGSALDGQEVSSRLHDRVFSDRPALRKRFRPERSKPQWS